MTEELIKLICPSSGATDYVASSKLKENQQQSGMRSSVSGRRRNDRDFFGRPKLAQKSLNSIRRSTFLERSVAAADNSVYGRRTAARMRRRPRCDNIATISVGTAAYAEGHSARAGRSTT